MSPSRQDIAQIIAHLDHPDGKHQRDAMELLLSLGPEIIDPLVASLSISEPRGRAGIIRVLGELNDEAALLPLMRFVFDRKDSLPDQNARGLAMEAISRLAKPSQATRLFDFLMQIRQDQDPFVRGWAMEALGNFGDPRATPIIAEGTQDPDEFVRQRARIAQERLAARPAQDQDALDGEQITDLELLQKLRAVQGGERAYYADLLLNRPNAFELVTTLIREGGKGALIGLQLLQRMPDERARQVATQYFTHQEDATSRAICLRIMAAHLKGDADAQEVRVIEQALHHQDEFVRMAAMAAAAASGHDPLTRQAIAVVERGSTQGLIHALEAAEALSRGLTPAQKRLLPELRDALHQAQRRRLGHPIDEHVQIEAHLLRAINNLIDDEPLIGTHEVIEQALGSLKDAERCWPVIVSALRLLRDLVGERMLPVDGRFSAAQSIHLLPLMTHEDDRVRGRVLDLLKRGAPEGFNALSSKLERLVHDPSLDLTQDIIPLIERAGGERARRLLMDLEQSKDPNTAQAAKNALRAMRAQQPIIEAKFTRPPE